MRAVVIGRAAERAAVLAACLRSPSWVVHTSELVAALDAALVVVDACGDRALVPAVRAQFAGPLVAVVGEGADDDELAALHAGADDVLRTPLEPRILRARVERLVRPRAQRAVGALVLDRGQRTASAHGQPVGLTGLEVELLWALAVRAGQVVSREQLYREVHHAAYDGRDRGLDIHVSRIRPKVQRFGVSITAVRGAGYVLSA